MDILNWRQKDTWGREISLSAAGLPAGELIFQGWSSHDAVYTSGAATTQFKKRGWFEQEVEILQQGERVGVATSSLLGKTQVSLTNGEAYSLTSEYFSNNRSVQDQAGNRVIDFKQGAFNFSKGEIIVADNLPEQQKEVLVVASLYLKLVTDNSIALIVIMFLFFYVVILN